MPTAAAPKGAPPRGVIPSLRERIQAALAAKLGKRGPDVCPAPIPGGSATCGGKIVEGVCSEANCPARPTPQRDDPKIRQAVLAILGPRAGKRKLEEAYDAIAKAQGPDPKRSAPHTGGGGGGDDKVKKGESPPPPPGLDPLARVLSSKGWTTKPDETIATCASKAPVVSAKSAPVCAMPISATDAAASGASGVIVGALFGDALDPALATQDACLDLSAIHDPSVGLGDPRLTPLGEGQPSATHSPPLSPAAPPPPLPSASS